MSEENVTEALRDVRMALLEADVALPVVKTFIDEVKKKAIGQVISNALNPGEQFVKIVHDELVHIMGDENDALNLATAPPAISGYAVSAQKALGGLTWSPPARASSTASPRRRN